MAREYMRCARRAAVGFMATAPWCTRPWESGSAWARSRSSGRARSMACTVTGLRTS